MKWLLYLLVLANAAFFAWQYQLREASRGMTDAREAAGPAYVTRLVMLSEAGRGGAPQGLAESAGDSPASTHAAEPASAPSPSAALAAVQNGAQPPQPAGAVPSPDAGLPSQEPLAPAGRGAAGPATGAPSPEATLEPPTPLSSPPAEAVAHEPAATAAPATAAPVTEAPPPERHHCYSVGPLAEDTPADPVRAWLVQHGAQVQSRVEQRQEPRSFWVYIPPAASAAAARETADRLQADGVKDVMRMTAGTMANAISLGLYNRRAAADQRVAELKRAGYSAEVETRFKEVRETWLDATFEAPRDLPREGFRAAFPPLKAAQSGCR